MNNTGINFMGLLTILFITLKLINVIDWSWIWVISPLWLPLAIFLWTCGIVIIGLIIFAITVVTYEHYMEKKSAKN